MKKWLVTILALCLVAMLLPITGVAEEECQHTNTKYNEVITVAPSERTYSEITGDDKNHKVVGKGTKQLVCADCGMPLEPQTEVESATQIEKHLYDMNGVCSQCGHVNTCQHEKTEIQNVIIGMPTSYSAIEGDNEYHLAKGAGVVQTVCSNCGTVLSGENKEEVSKKQRHLYENGKCNLCEYECTHNWNNGHCDICYTICTHDWNAEIGKCNVCEMVCIHPMGWTAGVCNQCGFTCTHDWNDGQCSICHTLCTHDWNAETGICNICQAQCIHWNWEDGVCGQCGFVCKHDGEKFTDTEEIPLDGEKWTDNGDGTCTVKASVTDVLICTKCWKSIPQGEPVTKTVTRNHFFGWADGTTCKNCGLKCESNHENQTLIGTHVFGDVYKQKDAKHHLVTGSLCEVYQCQECKTEFTKFVDEVEDQEEEHNNDGKGYCDKCGYQCPHSTTEAFEDVADAIKDDNNGKWKDNGDGTCSIDATVSSGKYCKDCGSDLEKKTETKTVTLSHSVDAAGTCVHCGHKENTNPEPVNPDPVNPEPVNPEPVQPEAPASVTPSKTSVTLKNAKEQIVTVSFSVADDTIASVVSSNGNIAKVSFSGDKITIKPAKKAGKATITVTTAKGAEAQISVTVKQGWSLNEKSITLKKGKSFKIKLSAVPSTVKAKSYESSNSSIVTVNKKGQIKAVAPGSAKITVVLSNGKKLTLKVKVPKK